MSSIFTKARHYSFIDIINGSEPKYGDYIGFRHVWDENNLVETDKRLDLNGHLPCCFKITKWGPFDPYHWCDFSTYFWLDEELLQSLFFVKNKRGDYVSNLWIRGKMYIVIVDEPKKFFRKKGTCRFDVSRFIFSTLEINFEGPLEHRKRFPIYDGQYCFFVMII